MCTTDAGACAGGDELDGQRGDRPKHGKWPALGTITGVLTRGPPSDACEGTFLQLSQFLSSTNDIAPADPDLFGQGNESISSQDRVRPLT